ncbi:hypothetical protein A5658_09585 [Mycobacterium sp. 1245111.1]|uniref:hypothetical protein n=1 Tax=Mycobacterium sp. 1245111.1 TaxID=1834073 RepID=UPI0007FE6C7F|nr:hypothetical protein [Mycobacterium sp. 1245111.1]OBK35193.1 hypothetical protein A5658_09585 [Mycobacterium sp. 1245111.1]
MSDTYDADALWLKAKLFINHAMDEEEPRTFDERALWATLALELLAKSALSRVSPALIASPNEEGTNILIASGLIEGNAQFTSLAAHSLVKRCSKAFRPFDEREARAIMHARNEYLHGGAPVFTRIPPEAWWPRFWSQAAILVNAQDKDIDDLVGTDRSLIVEDYLSKNRENIIRQSEMLIARAKQRLAQVRAGNVPTRIASEWSRPIDLTASLAHKADEACPACGSTGTLEGDEVVSTDLRRSMFSDDVEEWIELTVSSDYFSCPVCRLVLQNWELVSQAGLPGEFSAIGDYDDYGAQFEYGND